MKRCVSLLLALMLVLGVNENLVFASSEVSRTQNTTLTELIRIFDEITIGIVTKEDGTALTWGFDENENIELENLKQISDEITQGIIIKEDGTTWKWGFDDYEDIDAVSIDRNVQVHVPVMERNQTFRAAFASQSIETVTLHFYGREDAPVVIPAQVGQPLCPVTVENITRQVAGEGFYDDNDGWAFWGWFSNTQLDSSDRIRDGYRRPTVGDASFDLNTIILQQMVDALAVDGNIDLYAVWARWGDVNDDGRVDFDDVDLIRRHVGGITPRPVIIFSAADVHRNLRIDADDFDTLLRYVAGFFPRPKLGRMGYTGPTLIRFENEQHSVVIPSQGYIIVPVTARAYDERGNVLVREITFSLEAADGGVSIDEATGTVTITSEAQSGTVVIRAEHGNLVATANLTLRNAPQPIEGQISWISAGNMHSLALREDGMVFAWGGNGSGQLGDGTITQINEPTQLSEPYEVIQVQARNIHSLALRADGTVFAWGANANGQLGDGTTTNRRNPVQVVGLYGVRQISAGGGHSLALKEDGTVFAWGVNGSGQLGDGTTTNRRTPVQVTGLTEISQVSAGEHHSMALREDGTVFVWGNNTLGILGDGTTTNRTAPVQLDNLTGVKQIGAGTFYSVALKEAGTVWAWGINFFGQLGDGTMTNRTTPVQVIGLNRIRQISVGDMHNLALREDGAAFAWGQNFAGQLGDGTTTQRTAPVQVVGLSEIKEISAGELHNLALAENGIVWSWGANSNGQLGLSDTTGRLVPTSTYFNLFIRTTTEIPDSYVNINAVSGREYNVAISVNNITNFAGIEVKVNYDASVFEVVDLSRFTIEKERQAGRIDGTYLTITHVSPGEIRFIKDKVIADGKAYSGIVNILSFRAKQTQSSTMQISIN